MANVCVGCAYCSGAFETDDHVPPKGFFPKPRPSNLITVPSCDKCNSEFEIHDEYFQVLFNTRADVSSRFKDTGLFEKVLRGVSRPQASGLRKSLLDCMEKVNIETQAGIFLGTRDAIVVDDHRLKYYVVRIMRGLFYHEYGCRVPDHFRIMPAHKLENNPALLERFQRLVSADNYCNLGDGVFEYLYGSVPESPMSSVWLFSFYRSIPFGVIVRDPDMEYDEDDQLHG